MEVAPSYSECPNCQSASEAAAAPEAAKPQPAAPAAAPAAAPIPPPAPPAAARPRRSARPYLEALLAALTIAVVVLTVVVIVRTGAFRGEEAAPAQAAAGQALQMLPVPTASAAAANPVFKNIELTGFRLTEDRKQNPQLQFVVVNHSAADLGEIKAKANLRAATAKPEEPPAGTFSFAVTLGPYEAKSITVPLATKLRAYELPDWQLLRADITE